jgi:nitrogen fixation NifU-like protein
MSHVHELYQEIILDHNRSPRNFRPMPDATRSVEGFNPLCGDHYTVHLRMEEDRIADVSFEGAGCAISKASASVMSQVIKGKTRAEVEKLFREFHALVTGGGGGEPDLERFGKLAAFAGVSEFPARVKCASLAWHTMHSALTSEAKSVSTE